MQCYRVTTLSTSCCLRSSARPTPPIRAFCTADSVRWQRPQQHQRSAGLPAKQHVMQAADQEPKKDDKISVSQLGPPDGRREEPPEPEETPLDKLVTWLMPKERGDSRDMALLAVSIAVLVYLSMNLYNVYAMMYYAAGLKPISEFLPHHM